jgi:plasmid stabilization system protein ParE
MKRDENLLEFIEAAKSQGVSDDSLVGLLKGHGWPQDAVYDALAWILALRNGFRRRRDNPKSGRPPTGAIPGNVCRRVSR